MGTNGFRKLVCACTSGFQGNQQEFTNFLFTYRFSSKINFWRGVVAQWRGVVAQWQGVVAQRRGVVAQWRGVVAQW